MTCKLKYWREKKGLTQEQLAEKSGIFQPQISRYEHGQWPGQENQRKLATALDITVWDLIKEDENGDKEKKN